MTKTCEKVEVKKNDEVIQSCGVCGVSAYKKQGGDYVQTGLVMFTMDVSPNGFQTFRTRICNACRIDVAKALLCADGERVSDWQSSTQRNIQWSSK